MWSLGRPDVSPGDSLLIVDDRVTGATADVIAAGVMLGMPRREAEAMAPFATVMNRDPGEEIRRFEPVCRIVEDLVPKVEVVAPGLIFVPVAGAVKYYGGERELAEKVDHALSSALGGSAGVAPLYNTVGGSEGGRPPSNITAPPQYCGIANGPFAARWAAAMATPGDPHIVTDTVSFLSQLDLGTLRESMGGTEMIDTFRWLGISTLGDIVRLPRETLASRFGTHGVLAHRLASGEDRQLDPREITPELAVEMTFEDPLQALDAVIFAGRTLVDRLLVGLRSTGVAPHSVEIVAVPASGKQQSRVWRSADPFTEQALYDRVQWQLTAWVDTAGVPGGVVGLRVSPADLSGAGRQMGLLYDESTAIETERALVRAQVLLGNDAVLQATPQGGRMPAERVTWSRWGEKANEGDRDGDAPWPGGTPSPAPALIHSQLKPVDIEWDAGLPSRIRLGTRWEPVLTWSGPWRLSGRWWKGEDDADRYQLVTSAGAFLCVVAKEQSFLAAVYD